MFLVLMDATVLPFQLTFKGNQDEDSFDIAWLWITTLVFGVDVAAASVWIQKEGYHFFSGLVWKLLSPKALDGFRRPCLPVADSSVPDPPCNSWKMG